MFEAHSIRDTFSRGVSSQQDINDYFSILFCFNHVSGLNILMNNDDGFGVSNIREFYRLLVAAGHNVWMVAPAFENSGQGGRIVFTTSPTLDTPSQYNLIPAGAPSLGQDPHDSHIWYYNGTPAACTNVALDYVLPTFADFDVPDLFVAGPNFGNNVGTFAYTGSGTIGSTYTAVERNVPGIAFSAANPTQSYLEITNTTNPSTYAAEQCIRFVDTVAKNAKDGEPILPLGYGINVNIPPLNASCMNPPFVQSRFSGGSGMPQVEFNATNKLIQIADNNYFGLVPDGSNQCINGNCNLPGESNVVKACQSGVTIFTVDYDAPINDKTAKVKNLVFGDGW
ncbi:5'/3'-nucleotidase SurE [Rhinocladiella mackenziei CBS 650.93]|uniref:Rhinocladiella mackenziei CBS 650.93 unplaced genomic scaffold supercont1.4, whole genome shotgun sequence n=1 Tax=Rhinocladiella mackenziei CBS 650.93 TaxID=1442369 RepID=A0A0D2IQF5_9EURO|nr:5'/3'-nucleotidase SurE [Rhinocladiella mackenziei CBS 650.93]KIX05411.1 5'/3'-nucleotidase SurE [Rhinocladiella mackenziei CBS 650.93]